MDLIAPLIALLSILVPTKTFYTPEQPLTIKIDAKSAVTLYCTEFTGKPFEPSGSSDVEAGASVDVKTLFPQVKQPGTYILYAANKGDPREKFIGTPLVIEAKDDKRRNAPGITMITKVEPLVYVKVTTGQGPMTMAFYYDVAPNTIDSFLSLAQGGFYDRLTFHRIIANFVIQGGDPVGNGTGGPGYQIGAEFNSRPHHPGVLSMARNGDPSEGMGMAPRPEYANSAGSQFFICLDYNQTKNLDGKYTVFGKVVDGMETVKSIASVPLNGEKPVTPVVMEKVEVLPVSADNNPYSKLFSGDTQQQ